MRELEQTTFRAAELRERSDLQRLLRDQIDIVAPNTLVIAEEFGEWTDSRRRIDLLAIDRDANVVVIELKRTEDGGHMELQALRYAAMVSTLTAERAAEIFAQYLESRDIDGDAEQKILTFLGWEELDEERFGQDVRLVLVSGDFSPEITTSVLWLNEKGIDIHCVRMRPYTYDGDRTLVDVQRIIPLPEAEDYTVRVRAKKLEEKLARTSTRDFRRYDIEFAGQVHRGEWKRNAIWLLVQEMISRGIKPDEIAEVIKPARKRNPWYVVEGEIESPREFEKLARIKHAEGALTYSPGRFYSDAEELIVRDGKTYVFTKMWGSQWVGCLELIRDRWPELGLKWWASGEGVEE